MKDFLSPDSPVMSLITRIVNCVWLNILWFVFSIPVITIGASTTALFHVTLKMALNEEGNITSQFVTAFKENFRFATKVWGILLAVIAVFAVDGYLLWHLRFSSPFWTIITAVYIIALIALLIVLMYIFPLMAHFENTVFAMFKNSLMIGMRYLVCTAVMGAIYFAMILVVVRFFTPAVIFGEGLCAFLCSFLLNNVLLACEGPAKEDTGGGTETGEEISAMSDTDTGAASAEEGRSEV